MLTILSSRDTLDLIESRLPGHIRNLGDGALDNVKASARFSPLSPSSGCSPMR